MLVAKGPIVEAVKLLLFTKFDMDVSFYGNNDSPNMFCFVDTCQNRDNEKCVMALVNGDEQQLPIGELENKICKFSAVLRARNIAKTTTNTYMWSLKVSELCIEDLPPDHPYTAYNRPSALRFFKS